MTTSKERIEARKQARIAKLPPAKKPLLPMFYEDRNEICISGLHPIAYAAARVWLDQCLEKGIWVLLTSGYRSNKEQDALYALGRTKPGKKVTDAKGGESMHNYAVAIDFVPADDEGGIHYEDVTRIKQASAIAKKLGFSWGGDWKGKLVDLSHLQFTQGLTLRDFQKGKTIS